MNLLNLFGLGKLPLIAMVITMAVSGVYGYGRMQYRDGVRDTITEIALQAAEARLENKEEVERVRTEIENTDFIDLHKRALNNGWLWTETEGEN